MTPVSGEGVSEDAPIATAFVDTQPGGVSAVAESTDGGEAREGARRRRRGGRGGRDRDDARGPTAEGETGAEPGAEMPSGRDETVAGSGDPMPLSGTEAEANPPADGADNGERDGRRRSRGGRNRRDRGEGRPGGDAGADAAASAGVENTADVAADFGSTADAPAAERAVALAVSPEVSTPVAASYIEASTPAPEVRRALPTDVVAVAVEAEVVPPASMATEPPVAVVMAGSAPAPTPAPTATAASFVLETDALQAVAETAGLQWVNSDVDKIRAAQQAMANEAKPAHVARASKPVAAIDDGPLVLVETRRDLSQVKLPFETEAGSSTT